MEKPITNDQHITDFVEGCSLLVVIVSYQTGELVINTLKSLIVELSEHPLMRVIVVDNTCGKDAEIIEKAIKDNDWQDWVKIQISPHNGGFSFGNNLAIRNALKTTDSARYIWILNPDTEIYQGAGSALVKFLQENKKVGITGSCLFHGDGTEWGEAFRFPTILSEIEHALQFGPFSRLLKNYTIAKKMGDQPCQVDWVSGASMMIRRDILDAENLFDEDYFLYYEETDFCLNAFLKGWNTWYVPSSKVMHISGQSTGATGTGYLSKRLPQYMFDSRNHYFTKNHGFLYATIADIAKIGSLICNKVIRLFRGKPNKHHPYLLRDSILNFTLIKYIIRVIKK
ncbi:MAG: glycosyl transferase family 2 [Gammaproteobacteria bacterium]|nr:MAG: glycosyl transferase family 2 [Gammaproteobacteria bacterium]